MMITIIAHEAPYKDNDRAWNALRLTLNLLDKGQDVQLFLIDKGIDIGKQNHSVPEGEVSLEALIKDILAKGGEIKGCKTCITRCSIKNDPLIKGVKEGTMDELGYWVISSDRVISF